MKNLKLCLFLLLGTLLITSMIFSQTRTSGRVEGQVTDDQGTSLPGVTVVADSPALVGTASAVTDTEGRFRLLGLTPGRYTITFNLDGFRRVIREDIVVQIGETVRVNVELEPGVIEEEITVVGQTPLIDVKSTQKSMTITKEMYSVLPKGRDFSSLVTTVPGVNEEPWTGGVSIDGSSAAESQYFIDGINVNTVDTGEKGQSAAYEFVEEVQVIASGYQAQYSGSLGGVVNVLTKSGGNEYHGEAIYYYEGTSLMGHERDTLRQTLDDPLVSEYVNYQDMYGRTHSNRHEFGFNLGGYIIKDRLWFFGSYLPVYNPRNADIVFEPSKIEENFTQTYWYQNFQVKLTAQPFDFLRTGVSFVNNWHNYRGSIPSRRGTSNPDNPWEDYGYDYPNWTTSGHMDFTVTNNLMVQVRGGLFYRNRTNQQVTTREEPVWRHYGYGTGYYSGIPDEYQRMYGYANQPLIRTLEKSAKYRGYVNVDATYYMDLAGEHELKFGLEFVRQGEKERDVLPDYSPYVAFIWGPIDCIVGGTNYGRGEYGYYYSIGNEATGPYGGVWDMHNDRFSLYVQDAWTIGDRLTLNLGLRVGSEYVPPYTEQLPADIADDFNPIDFDFSEKIEPRIGFNYDVFGDSSLKIFGSYGHYLDVIKTYAFAHAYGGFKWQTAYYTLDTYKWDEIGVDGYFPGTQLLVYDWRHVSFDTTDPDMLPVAQREISFGVEKKLVENVSVSARLVQKHLIRTIEDVGVIVPGVGEVYYQCNPGFGYSLHTTNGGKFDPKYPETPEAKREYLALNLTLEKRMANNWMGGINYTLSRLSGNYPGLASSDEYGRVSPYVERSYDNWLMSVEKDMSYLDGPLNTDRPHYVKVYGAYTFDFGLTVGAIVNAMSGTPVTEKWSLLGAYHMPWGRGYYREGISGEDLKQKRTPFLWYANLHAQYDLKIGRQNLQFTLNVDNLLDAATAQRLYDYRNYHSLNVTEDQALSQAYDLNTVDNYVEHPYWMKETSFFGPISARLGVKFVF
ncbi:MAG: TonB-dependent receptor [Acidobacteriota bacterium]